MNTTGQQIAFNNAEAERIMAAHGSPVSLVVPASVEGDGVQPHSKGSLYPGVITVVDHHNDHGEFEYRRYLAQWKNEASASFRHREQAEGWILEHKAKAEAGALLKLAVDNNPRDRRVADLPVEDWPEECVLAGNRRAAVALAA